MGVDTPAAYTTGRSFNLLTKETDITAQILNFG
jgi:hypothetical protein